MQWAQIFWVIGALVVAFLIYRTIKNRPGAFSKENLSKSFYTLAILALILIAFIAVLIMLLRSQVFGSFFMRSIYFRKNPRG